MITRSKKKRTRENLNRLPREVKATLPSWVKCTDPISAETLKEVRSTVLVWLANVRNYRNKLYEDFGYSHTDELEQELTPDTPITVEIISWGRYLICYKDLHTSYRSYFSKSIDLPCSLLVEYTGSDFGPNLFVK